MKLPAQKKVLKEDLKDAPAWVNPLLDVLNSFMETIYQAMNKNITFRENIQSFIKEITYKTDSLYPVTDDISFLNELKVKPTGVFLMQVVDKSNYTPPPGPISIQWVEDNGAIIVKQIPGLEASKSYLIRLLVC